VRAESSPAPRAGGLRDLRAPVSDRLRRAVVSAPDRLVLLLFWAGLVVALAILIDQFRPLVVVPASVALVIATWNLVPHPVAPSRAAVVGSLVVLAVALCWIAINVGYASRYVVVTRDPGFLTLESLWLVDHPNPTIPTGSAAAIDDALVGARASGAAFALRDGMLYAQGAKLLPGLLAIGGWVGGDIAVLAGNLVIGALALLAVYGLGRRLTGPLLAVVPVVALAASMPMTAFSRAPYSEPLTVALAFGGLTVIWSGFETRTWWRYAVGASMIGATALVRIDGAAVVVGLIAGFGIAAAATLGTRARRRMSWGLVATMGASSAMVALGYLDLSWHSPRYLDDLRGRFSQLIVALVATAAVSLVLALPRSWDATRAFALRRRAMLGWVAAAAAVVVAVFLTSRPLWMVNHNLPAGSGYARLIEGLQNLEGLGIDPTRSYDEMSVTWLAWYYGWPMVVLAFAGLALILRRAVAERDPRWLVTAAVIGAPSALYLWRVSITPDQIWAMRRLLPVTIPGFLLLATVALAALWATRRRWARAATVLLAAVIVAFPLTTWGTLFTTVEHSGRYGQAEAVCAALPSPRVVFVGTFTYLPTLRIMCDAEVVTFETTPTPDELAEARDLWGGNEVAVVTFTPDGLPWEDGQIPPPLLSTTTTQWWYSISYVPSQPMATTSSVYLGLVQEDGTLVPIP